MQLRLFVTLVAVFVNIIAINKSVCLASEIESADSKENNDYDKREYLRVMRGVPTKRDYMRVMRSDPDNKRDYMRVMRSDPDNKRDYLRVMKRGYLRVMRDDPEMKRSRGALWWPQTDKRSRGAWMWPGPDKREYLRVMRAPDKREYLRVMRRSGPDGQWIRYVSTETTAKRKGLYIMSRLLLCLLYTIKYAMCVYIYMKSNF